MPPALPLLPSQGTLAGLRSPALVPSTAIPLPRPALGQAQSTKPGALPAAPPSPVPGHGGPPGLPGVPQHREVGGDPPPRISGPIVKAISVRLQYFSTGRSGRHAPPTMYKGTCGAGTPPASSPLPCPCRPHRSLVRVSAPLAPVLALVSLCQGAPRRSMRPRVRCSRSHARVPTVPKATHGAEPRAPCRAAGAPALPPAIKPAQSRGLPGQSRAGSAQLPPTRRWTHGSPGPGKGSLGKRPRHIPGAAACTPTGGCRGTPSPQPVPCHTVLPSPRASAATAPSCPPGPSREAAGGLGPRRHAVTILLELVFDKLIK